jgi:serine/threonine protein kinase
MSDLSPDPFSESVLGDPSAHAAPRINRIDPPLEQVGTYRIIELLGEGGMGEVYKAERRFPIRQTVAIKVVKLGMNSREIVGRFESERQALALMDHPGIARVLDAGTTVGGRPYFVMDFVAGEPITQFCDRHRLSVGDRLKLFRQVCDAIGHAHTKAIIHRDIKPSNVLAYLNDGIPTVKVIDFGIAKALTGDRLSDFTVNTGQGRAIGTYEYMSPEQAEGMRDIDTRTDVYSLGVVLYELLTGAKPFDQSTLSNATDEEMRRLIREVEPVRPSTRLIELGPDATLLAERRQARLDALTKQLRGELEWIPLMAMRKDRSRRYLSPADLAADIRNYLDGRPLLAGPESRSYRLKKYVRRHQRSLMTAAVVAGCLAGSGAYYVHSLRAEQAKTRAALTESERQRAEAQKQATIAIDSSNFLANIFRNANPNKSLGAKVTVVEALENAIHSLDDGLTKVEPITEAMIRFVTGTTLHSLGRYEEALPQLRRARELDVKYRSPGDPQIPVTLSDLALVLYNQGKIAEAEPLYRESLRIHEADKPPDSEEIASSLNLLASLLKEQKKFDEAEQLSKRSLDIRRRLFPPNDPQIASSLNMLALIYWTQGKLDLAEPLVRESLQMRQATLPAGHPAVVTSMGNLAVLLRDQGKLSEAEPLCREALRLRRAVLPAGHPDIGVMTDNLARILEPLGNLADAESLFRETLAIRQEKLPPGDPRIADSMFRLGMVLRKQGDVKQAESLLRDALVIQRARDPNAAPTTQTVARLAELLAETGRTEESAALRSESGSTAQPTRLIPMQTAPKD